MSHDDLAVRLTVMERTFFETLVSLAAHGYWQPDMAGHAYLRITRQSKTQAEMDCAEKTLYGFIRGMYDTSEYFIEEFNRIVGEYDGAKDPISLLSVVPKPIILAVAAKMSATRRTPEVVDSRTVEERVATLEGAIHVIEDAIIRLEQKFAIKDKFEDDKISEIENIRKRLATVEEFIIRSR